MAWDDNKNQHVRGPAIASLTDNSGGAADGTLQAVPAAYDQAAIANNFADLAAKVNELLVAMRTAGDIST